MDEMTRATEDYAFWRAALRGEKQPVHENSPQCGFYKRRMAKDGPWLPIAFWKSKATGDAPEKVVCGFQGRLVDPIEQWTYAVKNPVAEKDYRFHLETGHWPDEAPETPRSNLPSDPAESLKLQFEGLEERAFDLLREIGAKLPTKMHADKAANIRAQMQKVTNEAEVLFKTEKAPFLEGGRVVDQKFAWRKEDEAAKKLLKAINTFIEAEDRRQKEEARKKFEAERTSAIAEQKRLDEERKLLEASDPALAAITPVETVVPIPAAPEPPKKVQIGGTVGRKLGVKTVYEPEIVDYEKTLAYYIRHPQVVDIVTTLVRGEARKFGKDTAIPGVVVHERKAAA